MEFGIARTPETSRAASFTNYEKDKNWKYTPIGENKIVEHQNFSGMDGAKKSVKIHYENNMKLYSSRDHNQPKPLTSALETFGQELIMSSQKENRKNIQNVF